MKVKELKIILKIITYSFPYIVRLIRFIKTYSVKLNIEDTCI